VKVGRFLLRTLGVLVALGVVAVLVSLWAYRDIPASVLEARYGTAPSQFVTVDGLRMHYRDEGPRSGPVVLLIHANFSNLLDWQPWVDALSDRYRVVRFDMTSHGLTGPDPTDDYTLERTLKLTSAFIDALGVEKLTLGGTSLGGTIAIHYTAKNPQRVERLILLSPGSLEGKERRARGGVPKAGYVLTSILPRALPEFMLSSGFGDPSKLPDALVDRWYDFWMREGQRKAQLDRLSQYKAGDIEGLIRSLRVPVLLLWGELNTTAVFAQSEVFRELLKDSPSLKFIAYPGLGHMALQEDGARLARDVRAWLDAPPATGPAGPAGASSASSATAAAAQATVEAAVPATTNPVEAAPAASVAVAQGAEGVAALPAPDSPQFCVDVQRRMASTPLTGANRVFTDMPEFRHSKPSIRPFNIYQVVTYDGARPIRVSCKMKTSAHLRAEYGEEAAGAQGNCPDITRALQAQAAERLRANGDTTAADAVASFVVDPNEPVITGRAYLAEYPLSYRAPDGRVHLNSVGLFQNYDSWVTSLLPEIVQGQSYCHLPTAEYMMALATGAMQPGTVLTTADDARVTAAR
jgi:pimeloyl-ACP methyl ester carboxylesterase